LKSHATHRPLVAGIKAAVRSFSGLLFAALLVTGGNLSAAPDVKATQTDAFPVYPDGRAREGDTITYSTVISNATGTNDATGVQFTNPTPANTTDIVGSVTISPLAFPDTYTTGINSSTLVVPAASGVLVNDTGLPLPTAIASSGSTLPAGSGTYSLAADGSFTFTPQPGFQGAATFTYTVTNANSPDDSTTVTIMVDDAPTFVSSTPADSATNVSGNTDITVTFSEPVIAAASSFQIVGSVSGTHTAVIAAGPGPNTYTINPDTDFSQTETVTVTILAAGITDTDSFDPPDNMASNASFSFTVAADAPPTAVNDTKTVAEDAGATTIDVLANDTDPDGGPKSIASVTQPTNGTVVITNSGADLTYTPNANFCSATADTFTYTLTPGSSSATVSVTVTCVNDPPSFTKGADQTVLEDAGAQTVSPWATAISAGPPDESGQTLTFVVTNNTNATLFSAGPAVASDGTLTYTPAANANGTATITLKLTDGGGGTNESPTQSFVINVTAVNDAPSFTKGPDQTVNEDAGAQTVNPWATAISKGPADESGQTLTFVVTNNTNTGLFSAGPAVSNTGVLTYTPAPNANGSATITLKLTDNGGIANGGVDESPTQTFVINVTSVNDAPVLVAGGGSPNFTEDGSPVAIDPAITVTDDSPTLASGTISITGNYQSSQDVLAFTNDGSTMGNIAVQNNAGGVLTLTSAGATATVGQWQSALRAVTYSNSSQNPNTTNRTISFKVNDGALDSNTVNKTLAVTTVNDAPVLGGVSGGFTYTENDPATAIATGLTVTDVDSTTLTGATISISANYQSGQDVLSFTNDNATMGNIAVASNTGGVLTLTSAGSTATLAQWQSALRAVKYNNSSDNPNTATRTVSFQADDGGAANNLSNIVSRTITVTAVNDAPVVTASGGLTSFTEDGAAVAVDSGIGVSDLDSANLVSATIQITGNYANGQDVLAFANTANITAGAFDSVNGTLTLTGTDTVAAYQSALRSVTYNNTSQNPNTANRTVSFTVNDGALGSNTTTKIVTVTAVNDAPTFSAVPVSFAVNEDTQFTFTGGNAITVSDVDANSGNMTLTLSALHGTLTLTLGGGGTFTNNGTSSVTFVGTLTQVNAALASSKYQGNQDYNGSDTISLNINDGGSTGTGGAQQASASINVTVNAVNDAPVAQPKSFSAQANMKIVGLTGFLTGVTDADSGVNGCSPTFTLASVSATTPAGGTVTITNATTGTVDFDPPPGVTGAVTFTYTVSDNGCPGSATSAPATATVTVAGPVIWFVDPNAASNGDGRLSSPFKFLSGNAGANNDADDVDAGSQRIFVYTGTSTTGIALNTSEWLIGQGATNSPTNTFDALMGINPPSGTIARPSIGGTRPTLQGTVTLETNARVQGLNLSTGANTGLADPVGAITGVTVNEVGVTTTSGTGVLLSNIAGTLTFDNLTTTASGTGANLTGSNGSATFNFSGVTISSGANAGLVATGGGTINVTGAANTITSTTGTALNITNTTIGASDLTFRSINVTGSGGVPAAGIILNTTGATGSLVVTGNGGTCTSVATCTGGTIQGASVGVSLNSTTGVSFDRTFISNTQHSGIFGTLVTDFSFTNGRIDSSGTLSGAGDSNIAFNNGEFSGNTGVNKNIAGTLTITGNTLNTAYYSGLDVYQFDGTISNANISNNSLTSSTSTATSKSTAILLQCLGSASTVSSITKGTINTNTIANFPSNAGIFVSGGNATSTGAPAGTYGADSTTNIIAINGNTITGQSAAAGLGTQGIAITLNGRGTGNFSTNSNQITNVQGNAIQISAFGNTTLTTFVLANTINAHNINNSQGIGAGTGNTFAASDTPTLNIKIGDGTVGNSNNITNTFGNGILIVARSATGHVNARVLRNTVGTPIESPPSGTVYGIRVDAGNLPSVDDAVDLEISNNTTSGNDDGAGTHAPGIGLRKQGTTSTTNDFGIVGLPGGSTASPNVENYVNSQNPASASGSFGVGGTALISAQSGFSTGAAMSFLIAAPGGVEAAAASPNEGLLSKSALDSVVATAIQKWEATGLTVEQFGTLHSLSFEVADLPGLRLGEADGNHIRISRNAGGNGWFISSTSKSDQQFAKSASATRSYTDPASAPAGRVDLLTAIMHEMGHALGLPDTYDAKDRDKVMYGYLTTGERRVPATNDAAGSKPLTLAGPHYLSPTPLTVGTIPAGKSVTVRFKVTIGNPIPSAASPISSQGTVHSTTASFSDVLTDDPASAGTTDPTLTPVTIPPRAFSAGGPPPATGTVNQPYAGYTFAADGAPAPTYTVQSGTLPPGITLDANTGALAGTPTQVGVYSGIVVRATNTAGSLDTAAFTITINQVAATLSTQASASVSVGNTISDTATINGTSPGGTVKFDLFGPGNGTCSGTPIFTSTKPVSGNGNYTSAPYTTLAAGTYNWIATYSGDTNNAGAGGTCGAANESVTVTKGTTTMGVTTSKTPTVFGESVTFTATVSPTAPATTTPTGSVQFLVDNVNVGGLVTLDNAGKAQFTTSSLSVGPHTIKADYQGDTNYGGSNSTVSQTVSQAGTTTGVTSSVNPSKFGQSVTFTATVTATAPGAGTPTGTVQFKVDGNNLGAAVTLSGGSAQASTASITVTGSPHSITATYNGDSNFLGSAGSVAGGQTVNQAVTTTSVSSSANPSTPGQNVTFTATVAVTAPGAGTPTGTVQFAVDGNNLGGAVALSGNTAQASTSTITVAGSPHTVTATYSGDVNFAGSNGSLPGGQTVGKLSPTMTTQASAGVNTGGNITDTATLSGGTSPTGTITFTLFGPNNNTCSGAAIFTSTKTVSGNGPYTSDPYTATAAGVYRWVATYSGDSNNNGVNGACNDANESVTVSKVSPTISTQASAGINVGGNISDTATLAGGVAPTGTITFTLFGPNNNTCSGAAIFTSTVTVNGNGNYTSANFAPSTFGTYNWIATYSGDANNNTVAGACGAANESVFVDQAPTMQWSASTYSVNENGGSVTLTITRTGNTSQTAIVHYSTANGTATAGQDYTASSGDVNFGVGETSKPVVITILDDNASEGNETFTATLSAVAGAAVGSPQTTTVTIVDDEAAPTPTPTPTATPTATPTPTPTATPTPTPTPSPTPTPAQALNLSTRMRVDIGDKAVIAGFIITGNTAKDVVIRGLGPSLVNSNVPAATLLNDPYLELHGPNGSIIFTNDNWVDSPQRSQFENTVFKPTDNRESVILATLQPGNYTAILTGVAQTTGIGLIEVYDNNQGANSVLANISTRGYVKKDDEVMIGGFTLGGNPNNTRIAVRGIGPSLASSNLGNLLADPTLELHNANGTIMISNDDWTDDGTSAGQLAANGLALQHPKESGIFATMPPGPFTVILAGKDGGFGIGLVEIYNLR
jgi:hypothetical protein